MPTFDSLLANIRPDRRASGGEARGYGLHRIRPNRVLSPVGPNREYHEQFATTNLVALSRAAR